MSEARGAWLRNLVFARLIEARQARRRVTNEELQIAAYGDRADGGPISAAYIIRRQIGLLRASGAKIKTHGQQGWSLQ
jgi:hypothetical protein